MILCNLRIQLKGPAFGCTGLSTCFAHKNATQKCLSFEVHIKVSGAVSYCLSTSAYISLRSVNKIVTNMYVLIVIDNKQKGNVINGKRIVLFFTVRSEFDTNRISIPVAVHTAAGFFCSLERYSQLEIA